MQTLTEKRVFGAKSGTTDVYVASELGLVVVTVSADRIGEFGLSYRASVTAVAVDADRVVLGTDTGVLVGDRLVDGRKDGETDAARAIDTASAADTDRESETAGTADTARVADTDGAAARFEPIADDRIGSVVAAGIGPTGPLVADATGSVFGVGETELTHVGDTDGVRAIDGGLVAAVDGVYRAHNAVGLDHVGLTDVRDVAGHGVPLAATAAGLFWLGNGWMALEKNPFDRVAADGHGHALAVGPAGLRRRVPRAGDAAVDGSGWVSADVPVESRVVDVAYGGGIAAAITDDGSLCVDAGDGWRAQPLGIGGIRSLAVGPDRTSE